MKLPKVKANSRALLVGKKTGISRAPSAMKINREKDYLKKRKRGGENEQKEQGKSPMIAQQNQLLAEKEDRYF